MANRISSTQQCLATRFRSTETWAAASLKTLLSRRDWDPLPAGLTGWGTGAFDFDNDGYKDLFTANSEILDNSMEVEHTGRSLFQMGYFETRAVSPSKI